MVIIMGINICTLFDLYTGKEEELQEDICEDNNSIEIE